MLSEVGLSSWFTWVGLSLSAPVPSHPPLLVGTKIQNVASWSSSVLGFPSIETGGHEVVLSTRTCKVPGRIQHSRRTAVTGHWRTSAWDPSVATLPVSIWSGGKGLMITVPF